MVPEIRKVIGNKEEEVSAEDIYCKFAALRVAQRLIMEDFKV